MISSTGDPSAAASHTGAEPAAAASIDKVRDILFGNQVREFERRFARLEERIIKAWVRELKAAAKPKTIAPAEVVEPEWHPGRETQVPEAKPAVTGLLTTLAEMNLRLASLEDKVDRLLSVWS